MTISVSGLGSGLDYESWIEKLVAVKQSGINAISNNVSAIKLKSSDTSTLQGYYSDLLSSITKITDANFSSTDNLFTQKTATSSNTSAVTASVTSSASTQNIKVAISQLATATTAKSASNAASAISGSTLISGISEGNITEGSFSIYVDNQKYSIDVDSDSSLSGVLGSITTKTGLAATVDSSGKVTIGEGSTSSIVIGSTADTSNFSNVLSLTKTTDGYYQSSKSNWKANTETSLISADAGFASTITAGTFKIGSDEFTIGSDTTLDSLITEINNSGDANVTAYWDSTAGKLMLTAKDEGAININIEPGSSNFTDVMGLTSSGKLADNSQTLGQNAKATINGTEIISNSNTITSDISGLSGVTLTLKAKTTSDATVSVTSDTSDLQSAIKSFVSAFNTVISYTDTDTASTGTLYGETTLASLRNSVRSTATSKMNGDEGYKLLASIGITSGALGSTIDDNTDQLVIDSTKLEKALTENPDAIKKLLIGDDSTDGILTKLSNIIDSSLDTETGYFSTSLTSYSNKISDLNAKISNKTDALATYQTQLETKFSLMDEIISNLNKQSDVLTSFIKQISSSSSSSS